MRIYSYLDSFVLRMLVKKKDYIFFFYEKFFKRLDSFCNYSLKIFITI